MRLHMPYVKGNVDFNFISNKLHRQAIRPTKIAALTFLETTAGIPGLLYPGSSSLPTSSPVLIPPEQKEESMNY